MAGFDRDMQLDEILEQIRQKRTEEERSRAARGEKEALPEPPEKLSAKPPEPPEKAVLADEEKTQERPAVKPEKEPEVSLPDEKGGSAERDTRRSLKTAFAGETRDDGEDYAINKRMLPSSLALSVEDIIETDEIETPAIFAGERGRAADSPDRHPLFDPEPKAPEVIPPEREGQRENRPQTAGIDYRSVISEEVEAIQKKGVLNVKEHADDDEFKTFFSNTVVIDAKPLNQRRQRQKRITDFVVGDEGGPVFEEETAAEENLREYRSDSETEQVTEQLSTNARGLLFRSAATGILSLLILVFQLLLQFQFLLPPSVAGDPVTVAAVNAALMALVVLVNARPVFGGFIKLVSFRATEDSVTSFAAIVSLAVPVAAAAMKTPMAYTSAAASAAMFFAVFGRYVSAKRVLRSFRAISADYDKYATLLLKDDAFARRLTRELTDGGARILIKRKTGFTDDFLSHAMSRDQTEEMVGKPAAAAFFVALLCGVAGYLITKNVASALGIMSMAAVLMSPFTSTLAGALPIAAMQRYLSRLGCVVPGFSAAEAVIDANCVVLEGRELFPRGNVLLHGIKTFERERIDRAILYAASVLIQSCDTMSHMFLNVIQNKTEMLYDVDNIVYEDGLGFSCWMDKTRLLIGTRALLESRDIEVPSRDYENRYTKSSTRDAIYLAVAGKLYAMFVVSYAPSAEVRRAMREFKNEGISILLRTRDFNITPEKIASVYGIPRAMVSVVSAHDMEELSRKTAYVSHTPSVFTHIGSLSSYVGGILSCYRLQGVLRLAATIELVAMAVGALLAVLAAVFTTFTLSVFTVLLFQIFWLIVTVLLVACRRYS